MHILHIADEIYALCSDISSTQDVTMSNNNNTNLPDVSTSNDDETDLPNIP